MWRWNSTCERMTARSWTETPKYTCARSARLCLRDLKWQSRELPCSFPPTLHAASASLLSLIYAFSFDIRPHNLHKDVSFLVLTRSAIPDYRKKNTLVFVSAPHVPLFELRLIMRTTLISFSLKRSWKILCLTFSLILTAPLVIHYNMQPLSSDINLVIALYICKYISYSHQKEI